MLKCRFKKEIKNFCLDVDFTIDDEVLALFGASGMGKTLTLKAIAGIITPDEGEIILNDRVLFDSKKGINLPIRDRKVGYLFQDYALFPNFIVEENIKVGLRDKDEKKVDFFLREMQLTHIKDKYPNVISGGEKQRVALARILVNEPEVLLLDEPFSALDSYLQFKIQTDLKEILDKYMTDAILVSHNKEEVFALADSVITIDQGKTERKIPKETYFKSPATIPSAKLVGVENFSTVKVFDNYFIVNDWDMRFEFHIDKEIKNIGIKANKIEVTNEKFANSLELRSFRLIEGLNDIHIILTDKKYNNLRISISRNKWESLSDNKMYFHINPEDLIFFI